MNRKPTNRIEAPGKPGAAIIAKLEQLRDSHRLGIHIWENYHNFHRPDYSLALLDAAPEKTTAQRIQDAISLSHKANPSAETPGAISLSLAPKANSFAMAPYSVCIDNLIEFGFALDLSSDQVDPPLILRASPHNLISDTSDGEKILKLGQPTGIADLDHYMSGFTSERELFKHAATHGPNHSDQVLDMLGAFGDAMDPRVENREPIGPHKGYINSYDRDGNGGYIFKNNELIGLLKRKHAIATVLPFMPHPTSDTRSFAAARLMAAVTGLGLRQSGIEIPVVLYHITGPERDQFTMVGDSPETLRNTAMNALNELRAEPSCPLSKLFGPHYDALANACRTELGVDILDKQHTPSPRTR